MSDAKRNSRQETLFPAPRSRAIASTLGVLLVSVLVTAAMPRVLPLNEANSIVLPIILFPVTWTSLFLWTCFDRSMWRAWGILVGLALVSIVLIAQSLGAF